MGLPRWENPRTPPFVLRIRVNPQKVMEHFIKAPETFHQRQTHLNPWLDADESGCLMWAGEQGRTHILRQCLIFFLIVQTVGTVA